MIAPQPPAAPAPDDRDQTRGSTRPPSTPPDALPWSDADRAQVEGPAATFADPLGALDGPAPTVGHIGRYALKHQLGEGGIGTVYAAHDPLLSRQIAVKTLHVEVPEAERQSFNALFLNEARAAAGLSHPHIVTVFDAGISDDRAYIAMEQLKGGDLRQLRQQGWRPTPAQAALIVRRVADALGYAHSKGVVHRDVKPANIFMVGRTQPKVLDFGIARIAHQHEADGGDIAAGSPYYMAPEQVRHETVDRRADVFSLGVVFYELLTDQKPFRGDSLEQITAAVLNHEPPLANAVDAAVPEALARIAAKALAKNPEHRHRSARAFSRELRHWLDANTTMTDGEVRTDGRRHRSRPLTLAMVACGVVALGAIAWAALVPGRARPAAPGMAAAAPPAPPSAPASVTVPATAAEPVVATPSTPSPAPPTAAPKPPVATRVARNAAHEPRARDARDHPARTEPAAAPAPTGLVRIAISPWGEVEVNGRRAGASPPLTELRLPAGRHQIVVRNSDLPAYSASVSVAADQTVTFKHKF